MIIGAIEAGGTKFICGIGNEYGEIVERISIPTTTPQETIEQVITFFRDKHIESIGIGSFGPIDTDRSSPAYGSITTTPKPGWSFYHFVSAIREEFDIPIGWDSDVNGAALGEATWGAAQGLDNCVYFTVGTGIGAGVYAEGNLVHGLAHPEAGHIQIKRHLDDTFVGSCPYHGDCLEGLASGQSLEKRWSVRGTELESDHIAWTIEAYYLAQAAVNAILFLSPQLIIFGGGVMKQRQLLPMIRNEVKRILNGYIHHSTILSTIDHYIVAPGLGENAGLCGALVLGIRALNMKC